MKVKFYGGAEEVGRLGINLDMGTKSFLVDYGVIPEKPPLYPLPADPVNGIFITHSHLDHIGSLPIYYHDKQADFYATTMTANCMRPMLNDSLKVMNLEGYPERFNRDDVDSLFTNYVPAKYEESFEIGDITVTPYNAGHIAGSTMWKFEGKETVMVTGDLYTEDTALLKGANPVKTDKLIVESTYAGKQHEDRADVKNRLRRRVQEVIEDGGKVILPSFAVGRTQELIMTLADLDYDISVDGMGNLITGIYMSDPQFLRSKKEFRKAVGRVRMVRGFRMREDAIKSDIIITTSGMLDGGPVLNYLQKIADDPKSAIFLTGYQVEGTNGRSLLETGRIKIAGASIKPEMQIEFFDLSGHAGHDELVKFIKDCGPEKVILCHGDHREALIEDLEEFDLELPFNGREFTV